MAAIGWTQDDGTISWNCGGSLISENFIVTAGHCASWRKKAPDVARMGDLNLESDSDNKWAQQLEIEEVIPHPQYSARFNYYDIALIKLRGSIKLHDTVCPACLWRNESTRFPFLEACGYGQTGFLAEKTPKLQKVTLSPVSFESCKEDFPADRKLPQGLQSHQMCAADRSHIQDTCLGDSGGPLQIKLLGKAKMHPFIIGITSFGKSCGTETPGVYTRISHFVDWIESVTGIETDPRKCAMKYATHREFEPDAVTKSGDRELIDGTKFHVDTFPEHLEYIVKIGSCYGNLVTEKFVLSSATCVKNKQIQTIITNDNTEIRVKAVTVHPKFNGIDNDIALIEVQQEIEFNDDVLPACLFSDSFIPENLQLGFVGIGAEQNHGNRYYVETYQENQPENFLMSRSRPVNYSYCNEFYQPEGFRVDEQTKICYGNPDYFLVPDTCRIAHGAPIERELYTSERYHSFIFGLPVEANDCGFGYPAIATRVSSYIDWIDSIIFKGQKNDEICSLPFSGKTSTCKRASECPHLVQKVRSGKANLMDFICKFDDARNPLVCCPKVSGSEAQNKIENCPSFYLQHRQGSDESSHVALIGNGKTRDWRCRGYLISDKHVLTSTECVPQKSLNDVVALRNDRGTLYGIKKVVTNEKTLSLITLNETVNISRKVVPICLWSDPSKIPFLNSFIPSKIREPLKSIIIRPRPYSKCKKMDISNSVTSKDQSCLTFLNKFPCTSVGTGVQFNRNETGLRIPYLIGLLHDVGMVFCDVDDVDEDKPAYAFTKVAPHFDWILAHVD
ncbi:uncharacterized protein LOC134830260 [Culicoides brevitarsis]|uniref:uncharacterized protein LOC134830260 n=1 Tax=Culicoides brevitarsis TaxID=469753 RepID=UPI00307B2E80